MTAADGGDIDQVTIDVLPDDVLLVIFDSYLMNRRFLQPEGAEGTMAWKRLAHVCQRWRDIVFQSPRRLDLHILCTHFTPVREMLDIWPVMPLAIYVGLFCFPQWDTENVENIMAAFEHRDRISRIVIFLQDTPNSMWETLLPVMQESFPALTYLKLSPSLMMKSLAPLIRFWVNLPHIYENST